jgi:O-antigen ligase
MYQFLRNQNKISEYLFYSLIAVLFFSSALMNIIFVLILISFISNCLISRKFLYHKTPLDFPLLFFILAKVISVFTSISFESSAVIFYKDLPYYILFFILNFIISTDFDKIFQKSMRVLLFSSLIASIIGIITYAFNFSERAISLTTGYITLGIFLTVSLSIFLFLQNEKYLFKNNLLFLLSVSVLISGILFTFNRTHWIAVLLLLIVYSVYRKKYFYLLISILLAALIIIFIPSFNDRFFKLIYFWNNMSDRDIIWRSAYSLLFDKPIFGFGPNTFDLIFNLKEQIVDKLVGSWHNDYLQIYMESGLVGLISALFLIISVYYFGVKILKTESDKKYRIIATLAAISVFFIFGGFLDYLGSILFKIILSFFAVQITLIYRQKNDQMMSKNHRNN